MPILFAVALLVMRPALMDGASVAPLKDDALHYVAMAYNVVKYGVMTHSRDDQPEQLNPKYRREPLYPLLLAAALRSATDTGAYTLDCLLYGKECAGTRARLALANQLLIAATIVLTVLAGRLISGGWIAAYLAGLVLLAGNYFAENDGAYPLLTEPLAAFLMLGHALAGALTFRNRPTGLLPVLSGVCLGLLVLTKAAFQFWLLALLALWVGVVAIPRLRARPDLARSLALMLLPALLITGSWAVRNYVHFGQFAVSERGGSVLLLRAAFLGMTDREYRAAWCMWTPDELTALKKRLCADVVPADTLRFKRLEGKQKGFKDLRDKMASAIAAENTDRPRDHQQMLSGLSLLRREWDKQLWFTPLFAYRGAWVAVRPYRCPEPACGRLALKGVGALHAASSYARLLFIPALLLALVWALVKRRHDVTFFLLPAAYSFGIHAVATHYLPRYTVMLLPVLAVALAVSLTLAWPGVKTAGESGVPRGPGYDG